MASKVNFKDLDDIIYELERAGGKFEPAAKQAIYEGAKVMADAIRSNLDSVTQGTGNGDLSNSLFIGKMNMRGKETVDTRISFFGYDRNGVPNALKAAVLESGRDWHKMEATKFFSKAVSSSRGKAKALLKKQLENYWKELLGDK